MKLFSKLVQAPTLFYDFCIFLSIPKTLIFDKYLFEYGDDEKGWVVLHIRIQEKFFGCLSHIVD